MPLVHRFNQRVSIYIYPDDENPPHFHLLGPGWEARINIKTLETLIRGDTPARELAMARNWAKENQEKLLSKWNEYNEREN